MSQRLSQQINATPRRRHNEREYQAQEDLPTFPEPPRQDDDEHVDPAAFINVGVERGDDAQHIEDQDPNTADDDAAPLPFQPDLAGPAFANEEGTTVDQYDHWNAIRARLHAPANRAVRNLPAFESLSTRRLSVEKLNKWVEEENIARLLEINSQKIRLDVSPWLVDRDKTLVDQFMGDSFLDFLNIIPDIPGCAVICPPNNVGSQWHVSLELFHRGVEYRGKHAVHGFSTTGNFLYVGKHEDMDLWLVWLPESFFRDPPVNSSNSIAPGSSMMSTQDFLVMVGFMAFCLGKKMRHAQVQIHSGDYPNMASLQDFNESTNIL